MGPGNTLTQSAGLPKMMCAKVCCSGLRIIPCEKVTCFWLTVPKENLNHTHLVIQECYETVATKMIVDAFNVTSDLV